MKTFVNFMFFISALFIIIILGFSSKSVANCLWKICNTVINKEKKDWKFYFWCSVRLCLYLAMGMAICLPLVWAGEELGDVLLRTYIAFTVYFFGENMSRIIAQKYAAKTFLKYENDMAIVITFFFLGMLLGCLLNFPWYGVIGFGVAFMCVGGGICRLMRNHFLKKRNRRLESEKAKEETAKFLAYIKEDLCLRDNFALLLFYVEMLNMLEPSGHPCSGCIGKSDCSYQGVQKFSNYFANGCTIVKKVIEAAAKEIEYRGLQLPDKGAEPSKLFEMSGNQGVYICMSINFEKDSD